MDDRAEESNTLAQSLASYEAPRLTPIGNLRDILAGGGSQPCEGGARPRQVAISPGRCRHVGPE